MHAAVARDRPSSARDPTSERQSQCARDDARKNGGRGRVGADRRMRQGQVPLAPAQDSHFGGEQGRQGGGGPEAPAPGRPIGGGGNAAGAEGAKKWRLGVVLLA